MRKIMLLMVLMLLMSLTGCLGGGAGGGDTASPSTPSSPTQPTLALTDTLAGSEGSPITLNLIGLDPQGSPLTYTCLSGCVSGMALDVATGIFSWTPTYSEAGVYPIDFRVDNGTEYQDLSGSITVANVNRAPTLGAMVTQSITEGQTASLTPTGSDPDGDGVAISLTSTLPAHASFVAGVLTFAPITGQAGVYTFTFEADDGDLTHSQNFTVNVSNVNHSPVLTAISAMSVQEQATVTFTAHATDVDGDPLTLTFSALPTGATFNTTTGAFSWTPTCSQEGSYSITVTASDGGLSDSKVAAITVTHKNCFPPIWWTAQSITSTTGEVLNLNVGTGLDNDGTAITYGFTAEYDCNNYNWTQSFNTTTRVLTVTRTVALDYGPHRFVVFVKDADNQKSYRVFQIEKNSSTGPNFLVSALDVNPGTLYSTTGWCGATTVFTH